MSFSTPTNKDAANVVLESSMQKGRVLSRTGLTSNSINVGSSCDNGKGKTISRDDKSSGETGGTKKNESNERKSCTRKKCLFWKVKIWIANSSFNLISFEVSSEFQLGEE